MTDHDRGETVPNASDRAHEHPGDAGPRAMGPYSTSRRVGDVLYLAGQGAMDPATGRPVLGDITVQTRLTLQNVQHLLAAEGFGLGDLVAVTCYLTDLSEWDAMNDAYAEVLAGHRHPTRTAVGVTSLPFGLSVEMTCIAHRAS